MKRFCDVFLCLFQDSGDAPLKFGSDDDDNGNAESESESEKENADDELASLEESEIDDDGENIEDNKEEENSQVEAPEEFFDEEDDGMNEEVPLSECGKLLFSWHRSMQCIDQCLLK